MKRYITVSVLSLFIGILLLFLAATLLIGCSAPAGTARANQVHMATHAFAVQSTTINKGESITLVNDSGLSHIVLNGSWVNGVAVPVQEPGAPVVDTGQIDSGAYGVIGPFNTAGTYHVYCSLHVNMNLTIIVR